MSLSLQSQGFASFLCPTPDQFRAEVAWPGDWPEAQAGEAPAGAPAEAPDEADEAREDEEMIDLLDFLGGSGATRLGDSLIHISFCFHLFFLLHIILFLFD